MLIDQSDKEAFPYETLAQTRSHYCKPIKEYIVCDQFGNSDGMNGGCHWCKEMMPIQFEMCSDASWLYGLTHRKNNSMTEEQAIQFINNYKQNKFGMFEAERKHNYLRRKIGIWYIDKEWADGIFKEILAMFPSDVISKAVNSQYNMRIDFKDGSFIKMILATDSSRGCSFTDSYIQKGISERIYHDVIKHCNKPIFRHSIVVDCIEDFSYGKSADRYYKDNKEKI